MLQEAVRWVLKGMEDAFGQVADAETEVSTPLWVSESSH